MSAKPITIEKREKTSRTSVTETAFLCALMTAGVSFSVMAILGLTMRSRFLIAAVLTAAILFCTALNLLFCRKNSYGMLFASAAGLVILVLIGPQRWIDGQKAILNCYLSAWNVRYEDGIRLFSTGTLTSWSIPVSFLSFVLMLIPVIWHMIRRRALFGVEFLIVCLYLPSMILGNFSAIGSLFILSSVVGIWLFTYQAGSMLRRFLWLGALTVSFVLIFMITGVHTAGSVIRFRETVAESAKDMFYGKDTLPKGDLYQASGMEEGNETRLLVSTEQVKNLYLRGYTGADFTDGKWEPLKKSAYGGENFGFLNWLKQRDFDPDAQFASYVRAENTTLPENEQLEENKVSVTNTGADSRYAYTPYSAVSPTYWKIGQNRDNGYKNRTPFGVRKYQLSEYSSSLPGELLRLSSWIYDAENDTQEQYLNNESVYRSFVHEHYTAVDEDYADLIEYLFHEPDENSLAGHLGVYEAAKQIRSVLETNTWYTPKKSLLDEETPENEDLLTAFLRGDHPGNSAYYASAAVMAFRSFDIPARYAEGYFLSGRQIENADGQAVSLRSSDSHAWVEVYMDGIGWVPVDVTPGYYYDTYALLQMAQMPGEIQKTAALEDNGEEAESPDSLTSGRRNLSQAIDHLKSVGNILWGLLLLVILFAGLLLIILEIRHLIEERRLIGLTELPPGRRTELLFQNIQRSLLFFGLEVNPGWNCKETEQRLAEILPDYQPGLYIRVNELMEKYYYGGEDLKEHELRLLHRFLMEIRENRKVLKMSERFRMRYGL